MPAEELLSQEEIDQLLEAIRKGQLAPEALEKEELYRGKKVAKYNFKRPDKLSKEQMRALSMIHEAFARAFSTSLSTLLRSIVQIDVLSVDQITYGEFIQSIPSPTLLLIFSAPPLPGSALFEMGPRLSFAIVDRLLGGTGEPWQANREHTEVEIAVLNRVFSKLMESLQMAWERVETITPQLDRIEMNPQFVQIVPPNDVVVVISFDVKIGERVEGMMDLAMPYVFLEPILPRLSAQYWFTSAKRSFSPEERENIKARLSSAEVEVAAVLGKSKITVRDFLALKEGDIIVLSKRKDEPAEVFVGGKLKFLATPGVYGTKRAVQVLKDVAPGAFLMAEGV